MAGVAAQLPQARMPASALRLLGDDRLFRLASAGDQRAFEVIYERHHQALYRYCRSIVGNPDDAADALQSTMASALRGLVGEGREIPLRPWLFRIAHNESVSLLRKRRPHVAIDDALELEAPAHDPAVKQRLKDLVSDLRELPDGQRGALVMHELSGLRYREIAVALSTTEPHARQLVYEARTALHDLAEGRAMECETVRRTISDGDRRVLRGRRIRSHLRTCSGCAGFEQLLRSRKRDLAAIAPPLPAAAAAGLLHSLLHGAGSGGGGAAASSSGGVGLGSAAAGKAIAVSAVSKVAAVVAVSAVVGAGAVEIASTQHGSHSSGKGPGATSASHGARPGTQGTAPTGSVKPIVNNGTPASHGHGSSGATHGKATHGAHPLHPAHPTHPTHPIHPTHPTHPVHPTHPTQPVHPVKPTHPSHPVKPTHPVTPGGQKQGTSTQPAHPTHPITPTPKSKTPASTGHTPTVVTPTLPPEQQNNASGGSKVKVLPIIPQG